MSTFGRTCVAKLGSFLLPPLVFLLALPATIFGGLKTVRVSSVDSVDPAISNCDDCTKCLKASDGR